MNCPKCYKDNSKVLDSRTINCFIKRRRKCTHCNYRFTTYEKPAPLDIDVIKKDKSIEKFNRQKIYLSIKKACNKRPVNKEKIQQITYEIEHTLCLKNKNKISSQQIGKQILKKLFTIDKVAYIRFLSVYKNFKNIDKFSQEIKKINLK